MEQRDASWEQKTHDPKLSLADEQAVEWVDEKDHDQIEVQGQDGRNEKLKLSHPDKSLVTVIYNQSQSREDTGTPDGDDSEVDLGEIIVDDGPPVVAARAYVKHNGDLAWMRVKGLELNSSGSNEGKSLIMKESWACEFVVVESLTANVRGSRVRQEGLTTWWTRAEQ